MTRPIALKASLAAACLVALNPCLGTAEEVNLVGSGPATLTPLYASWVNGLAKTKPGLSLDYQTKGEDAGVTDFARGMVDLAVGSAPLADADLAQIRRALVVLPMTAEPVALGYNLPGVKEDLHLTREALVGIMLGRIARWNDAALVAANKGTKLPNLPISLVKTAQPSAAQTACDRHLAAIGPRQAKTAAEPALTAPLADGVAATIAQTPGALGCVGLAAARAAKVEVADLQNKAGKFVAPDAQSAAAALTGTQFPAGKLPGGAVPDLRFWAADPAGPAAYPILAFTWLLVSQDQEGAKATRLRELVGYALTDGQAAAEKAGYAPMPKGLLDQMQGALALVQ